MIVVSMTVPGFVASYTVPKMDLSGKTSSGKKFNGAINGGLPCFGITGSHPVVQILRRYVTITLKKVFQDQRSLGRHFQVFVCEMCTQDLERGYDQPPLKLRTIFNKL